LSFDYTQAYRLMHLIRRTEEEIVERYHRDQKMRCPTHLSIGQESAAVGVMMALDPQDHIYSTHRSHAHYLAKGGDLNAMIAELHGKATGCTGGWGGSMHLVDESVGMMGAMPVVGDYISMAIGSAIAFKLDGTGRVSVAFFGDSAVETGQFWEAANYAALHRLPIMFVCENNFYATSTHISQRQPPGPIFERVKGFMWSQQVNDEDIVATWAAAKQCRDEHPGFLEIVTYRYREHVGPNYDWDLGYRSEAEVVEHMARDPLLGIRSKLSEEKAAKIEEESNRKVVAAFDAADIAPWPDVNFS
jgi:TPP-dependent pyruvate/acetoin dehydrogenase alpha subunit